MGQKINAQENNDSDYVKAVYEWVVYFFVLFHDQNSKYTQKTMWNGRFSVIMALVSKEL